MPRGVHKQEKSKMPPSNSPPIRFRALVTFAASPAVVFGHYAVQLAARTSTALIWV
jgi:hypothetical protein